MAKKKLTRIISLLICGAIGAGCLSGLIGCGKKKKDSLVLMTEELSGLYNPFYATSGTDMDVVGFTQMGMLTYDADDNGNVTIAAGDEHAVVSKAYDIDDSNEAETVYTFVIKNGLKFSDGKPLTMNDVMFNIYEYLDPVYTGSSTMYSVKIKGLTQYRTQIRSASGGTEQEEKINENALGLARLRRQELIDIYEQNGRVGTSASTTYSLDEAGMKAAIAGWNVSEGYKSAVATEETQATLTEDDYHKMLLEDYDFVLKTHKEEIQSDFKAAKESYDTTAMPYSEWADKLSSDIFKFFLYEGYITPKYQEIQGKENKNKILSFDNEGIINTYPTEEAAVQRVYDDNIKSSFNNVLSFWGTAGTVLTEFTGAATEIVIRENMGSTPDGKLNVENIEGIVSLGHTTQVNSVTIDNVTYNVAHEHNEDGTPANPDEYDVLQITVEGQDPKAIYNFGFSVTPAHYYTADADHPNGRDIDIEHNKFGVEYASASFQSNTIKSLEHVEVPVGAGPFMATNRNNDDNPQGRDFVNSNIVYYKANHNFVFPVKTEKLRLQVVSPSDALDVLQSGAVDYVTPQFTDDNSKKLNAMEGSGYVKLDCWQLGYGYIGINAGKVPDLAIRKAIMSAMEPKLANSYYDTGTCETIYWPMSKMSWAYPDTTNNGHDYTQFPYKSNQEPDIDAVKQKILGYMSDASAGEGDSRLKITFTIAGSSITEHPTYSVFKQASEILNSLGWDVTVKADTQALTKLSTGSLSVWAAAWGSTIDPDMYQVYHKNSTATSVYAWGYREIKASPTQYVEETRIINDLSEIIDEARSITNQGERARMYKDAMSLVLDLAVEMPVYQRKNLYAYNGKTVRGFATEINPYTSPLDKVWELELI